jgi:hypothetical protein
VRRRKMKKDRKMKKYLKTINVRGKKMSDKYGGIIDVVEWVSIAHLAGEIYIGKKKTDGNCHVLVDLTNSGGCAEVALVGAKYVNEFVNQYKPMYRESVYQNDTLAPAEGWHWVHE